MFDTKNPLTVHPSTGFLAALLLLVLSAPPLAATPHYAGPRPMRFELLSIADGLSQGTVNCVLQDSTGFLWLGTQGGLNRYDGYGFEVYQHHDDDPASLAHDYVLTLAEDPSGDLWAGTEGGGLSRWRRTTDSFTNYRYDPDQRGGISSDRIVSLAWDGDGILWIGTLDAGLDRYDPATGEFENYRHDPEDPDSLAHDQTGAVYLDRRGDLWVGTWDGLDRFDKKRRTFIHFRHHPDDPRSLSDGRVRAIVEDGLGHLWVGTYRGVNRYVGGPPMRPRLVGGPPMGPTNRRTGTFERYLNDPADPTSLSHSWVRALHTDRDGRLWVGTDGGLNLWQPAVGAFDRYHPDPGDPSSLGSDQVKALYQDQSGILWISTIGAGVNKWNPRTWSFPHYRDDREAANNNVFAISEDRRGGLWVGTLGGGLERIERSTDGPALRGPAFRRRRYTHDPRDPASLADDRVTALTHDRQGTLWIGTVGGGLNRFVDRDPAEAGSGGYFERYLHDPQNPDSLSVNAVTTLYEDRRGRLWIGTLGGGLELYQGDGTFTHFRHHPLDATSLGHDRVFALAEDRGGRLWVATDGGGLNRLHPATGAFLRLVHDPDDPASLSSNELMAVHVDASGRLWAGTKSSGLELLESLDEATGRAAFRHYTAADGLPDESIWGIRSDAAGGLWLATNSGLARLAAETGEIKLYGTSHGLQSDEFNMGAHFQSPSGELFFGGVNGLNAFFPDRIEANPHPPAVVATAFTKINRPVDFDRPLYDVTEIALAHRDYFFSVELAALDFTAPAENSYRYKLEGFDADWVDLGHRRRVTFTNLDPGRYTLRFQGANHDGAWNREGASIELAIAPPPWQSWWAWSLYILALGAVMRGFVRHQQRKVERQQRIAEREREIARRERAQADERQRLVEEREALIEELEAKNAELERFNYTVSHDLKSPLVTIKGFLGLLEKDALAVASEDANVDRLKHDVRRIGAAADRMRRLLDELLELSRLGRHSGPPEEVALSDLAREAWEMIRGHATERGVAVLIDPRLPVVFGDRLRLLQLFQNLLANAVKYMGDQSAPRVEVGLRDPDRAADDAAGGERTFFVRDNGMGIDERYHEKVFGLFERLDAGNDGTGIGLALAKRIVDLHGGRIWVESEGLGSGSTFCFTLAERRIENGEEPEVGRVVEAGDRFR